MNHEKNITHGSLFSGQGGFDLAAQWMNWINVFHCEKEPFNQKILKYYWQNALSYGDIKETDFTIHRGAIDVLTGGFPCQPYSQAGKRKGKEDERHLWPEMLRAIREIQPTFVVGENVLGIITWEQGLVFNEICIDLEAEGYEVQPYVLPASGKNAPHQRYRIFFVAYSNRLVREGEYKQKQEQREFGGCNRKNESPDITGVGREKVHKEVQSKQSDGHKFNPINEFDYWGKFPTQYPICSGNDGFPGQLDNITFPRWRMKSIEAAGNAIVPQLAFEIFKCIEEITKNIKS